MAKETWWKCARCGEPQTTKYHQYEIQVTLVNAVAVHFPAECVSDWFCKDCAALIKRDMQRLPEQGKS